MTNREKQAQRTKQKIFDAAVSVMQKHGFEETTIGQICKKAKVSVGAFYVYFKSKQDVLLAVYKSADEYFKDVVEPALAPMDYRGKVLTFFTHYARYNIRTGLDFVKRLYGSENKLFIAQDRYMHSLLHTVLVSAERDGKLITDMPLPEAEQFMFIMARGIVSDWCVYEGEYDLENKMIYYFSRVLPLFLR